MKLRQQLVVVFNLLNKAPTRTHAKTKTKFRTIMESIKRHLYSIIERESIIQKL